MVKIQKFFSDHWLALMLFLALFNTSLIYLKVAANNLSYPYAILAGLEDENLARALMVLQGKSLYPALTDFPFVVTLYPPVYFYLAAVFVKILGVSLFAGRVLSLTSSLLLCLLCFRLTWFLTKNFFWGVAAGLFFMASGFIQWWGLMFKNDILAVFFSFLGIYLFLEREKSKRYFLPILFLVLGVLTKQTAVTAPLAVMTYLFFSRRSNFLAFSFRLLAFSFLPFFLLVVLTRGQFLIDTILVPKSIVWDVLIFAQFWHGVFYSYGWLLLPAFGFVLLELFFSRKLSLLSWYFIFSVLARYDSGIIGSSDNYFMETIALGGVLASLFFHRLSSLKTQARSLSTVLLVFLILILLRQNPTLSGESLKVIILVMTGWGFARFIFCGRIFNLNRVFGLLLSLIFLAIVWQKFVGMSFPFAPLPTFSSFVPSAPSNLAPFQKEIDDLIKDNPGRVLVDSESFLAIKNQRDFEYIPMALKLRRQAGYWNFEKSKFFEDIGQQKFRFYIKSQGWTDPEIMYKIYQHYKLSKIVNAGAFLYEIFEPMEKDDLTAVAQMRLILDEAEIANPKLNQIFVKKLGEEKYLLGFTFADDNIYGSAFVKIVNHPQFVALYRPLHSRHPNSSAVFRLKNLSEVQQFAALLFAGPGYEVLLK